MRALFKCPVSAGKYLKPYQGLKLSSGGSDIRPPLRRKIPKTLSGIETFVTAWLIHPATGPENT